MGSVKARGAEMTLYPYLETCGKLVNRVVEARAFSGPKVCVWFLQ